MSFQGYLNLFVEGRAGGPRNMLGSRAAMPTASLPLVWGDTLRILAVNLVGLSS